MLAKLANSGHRYCSAVQASLATKPRTGASVRACALNVCISFGAILVDGKRHKYGKKTGGDIIIEEYFAIIKYGAIAFSLREHPLVKSD